MIAQQRIIKCRMAYGQRPIETNQRTPYTQDNKAPQGLKEVIRVNN